MKNLKIILAITSLIILIVAGFSQLPKGNDLVQWENDMKKIEQFNKR